MEFYACSVDIGGIYPAHVGSAVFNRLQIMQQAVGWDRCLIMDHDMLALCDLEPYFEEGFECSLLLGRLFGPGNTLGFQMTQRGGLPEKLKHTASYPYFYMGPMMNLRLMREEGTWEKLLTAHETLGQDEQMALTIATEGRVKGVGRMWNLVPQWDHLDKGPQGPERSIFGTVGSAATWKDGLPQGIIHWTGWAKPWNKEPHLWRPDLWESEETSWEALRNGWWKKPQTVEVEPGDFRDVNYLARRGWKVQVIHPRMPMEQKEELVAVEQSDFEKQQNQGGAGESQRIANGYSGGPPPLPQDKELFYRPFPDVSVTGADGKAGALSGGPENSALPDWNPEAEMVRFGVPSTAAAWLKAWKTRPPCIVLRGPATNRDTARLAKLGYGKHCLIRREDWPAGGPAPSVLELEGAGPFPAVRVEEDLYLWL